MSTDYQRLSSRNLTWEEALPVLYSRDRWGAEQAECFQKLGQDYVGCYYFELVDSITAALVALQTLITNLQAELADAQSRQIGTSQRMSASDERVRALENEINALREQVASGQVSQQQGQETITRLQTQLDNLENTNQHLVNQVNYYDELVTQLTAQLYDLQNKLAGLMQLGEQVLEQGQSFAPPLTGVEVMFTPGFARQLNQELSMDSLLYQQRFSDEEASIVQALENSAPNVRFGGLPYASLIGPLYNLLGQYWAADGGRPIGSWQQAYDYMFTNRDRIDTRSRGVPTNVSIAFNNCPPALGDENEDQFAECPIAFATNQILALLRTFPPEEEQPPTRGRRRTKAKTTRSPLSRGTLAALRTSTPSTQLVEREVSPTSAISPRESVSAELARRDVSPTRPASSPTFGATTPPPLTLTRSDDVE